MSLPDDHVFSMLVPSNSSNPGGSAVNQPWNFEVPLVRPLNFKEHQDWQVALTSIITPPTATESTSQVFFVYSDLVGDVWVGDQITSLLSMVDVQQNQSSTTYGVHEPEHPMFHPLRVGYIEKVWVQVRDEKGQFVSVHDNAVITLKLEFRRQRYLMGERYLILPSNVSKTTYADNNANSYTVVLPGTLNYHPDEWEAALTHLSCPRPSRNDRSAAELGDLKVGVVQYHLKDKDHVTQWFLPLHQTEYHNLDTLLKDVNHVLGECVLFANPDVRKGSYVEEGKNKLRFDQWRRSPGRSELMHHYYKTIPAGFYTLAELIEAINQVCPRDEEGPLIKYEIAPGHVGLYLVKTLRGFQMKPSNKTKPTEFCFYTNRPEKESVLTRLGLTRSLEKAPFVWVESQKKYRCRATSMTTIKTENFMKMAVVKEGQSIRFNMASKNDPQQEHQWMPILSRGLGNLLGFDRVLESLSIAGVHSLKLGRWKTDRTATQPTYHVRYLVGKALHWGQDSVVASGLYVYSDLVQPSFVGNTSTPLLGVVPVLNPDCGDRQSYEFKNPMYVPLRLASFGEISLYLRDRQSNEVFNDEGLVVATLHVRPRER